MERERGEREGEEEREEAISHHPHRPPTVTHRPLSTRRHSPSHSPIHCPATGGGVRGGDRHRDPRAAQHAHQGVLPLRQRVRQEACPLIHVSAHPEPFCGGVVSLKHHPTHPTKTGVRPCCTGTSPTRTPAPPAWASRARCRCCLRARCARRCSWGWGCTATCGASPSSTASSTSTR